MPSLLSPTLFTALPQFPSASVHKSILHYLFCPVGVCYYPCANLKHYIPKSWWRWWHVKYSIRCLTLCCNPTIKLPQPKRYRPPKKMQKFHSYCGALEWPFINGAETGKVDKYCTSVKVKIPWVKYYWSKSRNPPFTILLKQKFTIVTYFQSLY